MKQDNPWKEALEKYFKPFTELFFPEIYKDIDWKRGYVFLDKELEKIVRDSKTGSRRVDKLVRVCLSDGKQTLILIHIEIQGYRDAKFEERIFVYNYRLFDKYGVQVVSLAVLTDNDPDFKPSEYLSSRWNFEIRCRFPVIKLTDFFKKWNELENNRNPFSIVVMAHLKAMEFRKGKEDELKKWKFYLIRMLYQRGYKRKDILELCRFIDWLMVLPEALEKQLSDELTQAEEEKAMPYVTSWERIGRKEGRKKGKIEGKKEGKKEGKLEGSREMLLGAVRGRFGRVPRDVSRIVRQINDLNLLKSILIQSVRCQDLEAFCGVVNQITVGADR